MATTGECSARVAETQDVLFKGTGTVRPDGTGLVAARAGVELRAVGLNYKGVAALRGIDLTIHDGEFFSLLGPSGCGKTSTLNVIGGFIEPATGDVLIQSRSVRHLPPYRRPVNTVFQSYALFPHMTVAENVAFGPRMSGDKGPGVLRRVRESLALVSLTGMEDRRPDQLSGGQQQRVALARALINRPSVLLLDEPLGALDLKLRKQMQLELSRIQREVGITFVYVTHDQEEAMTMSDRIAVMNHGRVEQVGSPQEVYERPANLFVADFIGSSNILLGTLLGDTGAMATVRLDSGAVASARARTATGVGTARRGHRPPGRHAARVRRRRSAGHQPSARAHDQGFVSRHPSSDRGDHERRHRGDDTPAADGIRRPAGSGRAGVD